MNYEEALDYIHSIPKFRRPLGNENLARLLALLGNPQKKLRFIHIAGTNGKGSTAAMTGEILRRSGYKTGLFTSPFIEVFNERIRVNGKNIPDSLLIEYTEKVKNIMETSDAPVSEFAFVTAIAFLYFCEQKCDFVVLEVGMGGKLDATNVIDESVVSVICKIALDHTQYLGETIEEIALEKCGIIKENGTVVSYPNEEHIMDIIKKSAGEKHAEITVADLKIAEGYELSLKGAYQKYNAAVVVEIVRTLCDMGYDVPEEAVVEGLKNTKWAARFEFVRDNVIIDGAHNPDGIRALKESLASADKDITIVMAMMEDKAWEECVKAMCTISKRFIATELDMPRCLDAEKIADAVGNAEVIKDMHSALSAALADKNSIVCVCGSLYLAGEAKKFFRKS